MPAWNPSLPWPGSPGGAWSPHWGGYVRLFVRAAIAAGNPFTLGPSDTDRLDAGNVLGGYSPAGRTVTERLWADLSCDVTDLTVIAGAGGGEGVLSQSEAATCQVTLADPLGIYDPTNPDSPWTFAGHSRLIPGAPVEVFAEVVDAVTGEVTTHYLFTGTADSWGEDWTPNPRARRAQMIATDATKTWARYNRPEQPPAGAGENTRQRVDRLAAFYGWPGVIDHDGPGATTHAATTLAQPGWELLTRTLGDELGFVYFTPTGELRWTRRDRWFDAPDPILELGCESVESGLFDVLTDASPSSADLALTNVVRASRTGGVMQTAQSTASVDRFGPYEYQRTDLGVETDAQAAEWATALLTVSAYPRVTLENVTMRPAISPVSWDLWPLVLDIKLVTDAVRLVWAPPDRPTAVVETTARPVGTEHHVTRAAWETTWNLATADVFAGAQIFTLGAHPNDRLDAGNVLALA